MVPLDRGLVDAERGGDDGRWRLEDELWRAPMRAGVAGAHSREGLVRARPFAVPSMDASRHGSALIGDDQCFG
jgi:hypothetical protein